MVIAVNLFTASVPTINAPTPLMANTKFYDSIKSEYFQPGRALLRHTVEGPGGGAGKEIMALKI